MAIYMAMHLTLEQGLFYVNSTDHQTLTECTLLYSAALGLYPTNEGIVPWSFTQNGFLMEMKIFDGKYNSFI